MAPAISSLPVPVSPSIRTVESVGATRLTCSRTVSSGGLLPMICSNLLMMLVGKALLRSGLLSSATCAVTASSISKDGVLLTAGALLAQLSCAVIVTPFVRRPYFCHSNAMSKLKRQIPRSVVTHWWTYDAQYLSL